MNLKGSDRAFRTHPPAETIAVNKRMHTVSRLVLSAPATWKRVEQVAGVDDFRIDNVPARISSIGDLRAPLAVARGRFRLKGLFLRR